MSHLGYSTLFYVLWEGKMKACNGAVGWLQSTSLRPGRQGFVGREGVKTAKEVLVVLA